jgi:hypothetical protein
MEMLSSGGGPPRTVSSAIVSRAGSIFALAGHRRQKTKTASPAGVQLHAEVRREEVVNDIRSSASTGRPSDHDLGPASCQSSSAPSESENPSPAVHLLDVVVDAAIVVDTSRRRPRHVLELTGFTVSSWGHIHRPGLIRRQGVNIQRPARVDRSFELLPDDQDDRPIRPISSG